MRDPFAAIVAALNNTGHSETPITTEVRIDLDRRRRTGSPEIVFGQNKTDEQIIRACERLLAVEPRVIVSRVGRERMEQLASALGDVTVEQPYPGETVILARPDAPIVRSIGHVAVITAGTSDLSAAGEAATVAFELGCRVTVVADVGIAGLHRLVQPLRDLIADDVAVIIVAAGMDGALPTVVTGLVDVPVIGLPTSVGYGVASGGNTALGTMLSSCTPGLAVVNIDNGVGAGVFAARIAHAAARHNQGSR
ncbi:MAG: nickel pincer cofactor biosynthesis protein LarB [Thermomicrobiales bacterium]